MKTTLYFQHTRQRPDRAIILDAWIEQVIKHPVREEIQSDGRIRRWARTNSRYGKSSITRYPAGRR
jgi:hypothetical protein